MRIYVVHPGVPFSTADVHTGLCAGLRANGCEVIEGRLDEALVFQTALYEAGQQAGVVKQGVDLNYTIYASPYIVQHAIAVEPDAVVVVSAHNFNIASAKVLRQAHLKTAVIMTESPYFAEFEREMASAYDVVFTNERRCATGGYFDHPNVHYLPHAYNPSVHRPGPVEVDKACDVVFIGSLFEERARLFEGVDWSGIEFVRRGYVPRQDEQDIVGNDVTCSYYRSARISLNHHRTTTEFGSGTHIPSGSAESLGPRAYEIAGCGGFQLVDDSRAELWEVFGECAATYRAGDADDLSRQIRYWLKHPDRREETTKMQHAAIRPHTWKARAAQLLEVLV